VARSRPSLFKCPAHARQTPERRSVHASRTLDPTIRFLDPFADRETYQIAAMARRPLVDV
jgi:hypothetical protein